MAQATWIVLLAVVVIGLSLVAAGVIFYPKLKREQQGYPLETQIEAELLPLAFQGICSAYRLSEQAIDEAHARIQGADKKKIADSIYAMLPDKIGSFDLSVVKMFIPPERFEQIVQDAFDRFDRFFMEHQEHFAAQFEEWKAADRLPF